MTQGSRFPEIEKTYVYAIGWASKQKRTHGFYHRCFVDKEEAELQVKKETKKSKRTPDPKTFWVEPLEIW